MKRMIVVAAALLALAATQLAQAGGLRQNKVQSTDYTLHVNWTNNDTKSVGGAICTTVTCF